MKKTKPYATRKHISAGFCVMGPKVHFFVGCEKQADLTAYNMNLAYSAGLAAQREAAGKKGKKR